MRCSCDDAFFLAIGRHIADAPLAPFGFDYNWAGTPASVWAEMKNPPGLFYLHAALQRGFGASEPALHLVFWLFPVCATQACYELAAIGSDISKTWSHPFVHDTL